MPPYRYEKESELLVDALHWLISHGIAAWRNNSGVIFIKNPITKKNRMIKTGITGSSDIIGVLPVSGKFLAAEAKVKNNKVTKSQQNFLDAVNRAGGVGFVFRDLKQLERGVRGYYKEPKNATQ